MKEIKSKIIFHLTTLIERKIKTIQQSMNIALESRNEATKSSAGDKHETSRALIQTEIDNYAQQLNKALIQKNNLKQIPQISDPQKVELGSLVMTNEGTYFIGIGWGKLSIEGENYFCISLASPIGKSLMNQENGNNITFSNRKITIIEIY
ncbi:MAG: 3-oxoacyl-ACP synthase [Crocinitomicaceae bacterium]|nr:3-oxoacyl-ACP synthase [Crocinitomicaceae bacterium]|tara:strand:- start:239 stop:691 length:453 start_codon:yes stop_codon:yes gene_type:complete